MKTSKLFTAVAALSLTLNFCSSRGADKGSVPTLPDEGIIPGSIIVQYKSEGMRINRSTQKAELPPVTVAKEKLQAVKQLIPIRMIDMMQIMNIHRGTPGTKKYTNMRGLVLLKYRDMSVEETNRAVARLKNDPAVLFAEPDIMITLDEVPDDPDFEQLWGMFKIRAPEAWNITTGSMDVTVGIIDSGVDYTHPDLAPNIWVNDGEIPGDGIDNDNNGYIDDTNGYDFYSDDNDPMDEHYHGTHVAGTVGASGNNGLGVAGVNWRVRLVPLRFLGPYGGGPVSAAVSAIYYAITENINILNNSWGSSSFSEALKQAITDARDADILFLAAAGNSARNTDERPYYPQGYNIENVISVASTNSTDSLSSFSCYGVQSVDTAAPGSDIYSTFPTYTTQAMDLKNFPENYHSISGTSMATPHVAGAAAMIKARHPDWSYSEVKDKLLNSAAKLMSLEGLTANEGRLNLFVAVFDMDDSEHPVIEITNPSTEHTPISGTTLIQGTATDDTGVSKIVVSIYEYSGNKTLIKEDTITGVDSGTWEYPIDTSELINTNTYRIHLTVFDTAYKSSETECFISVMNGVVDMQPPVIKILSLYPDISPIRGYVYIKGYLLDNMNIFLTELRFYSQSGGEETLETTYILDIRSNRWEHFLRSYDLTDGEYRMEAKTWDTSGNTSSDSVMITIQNSDTTPPTLDLLNPVADSEPLTVKGTVFLRMQPLDNSTNVTMHHKYHGIWYLRLSVYRVNNSGPDTLVKNTYLYHDSAWQYHLHTPELGGNGLYRIEAYAVDRNSQPSITKTLNINVQNETTDTEIPSVTITNPGNGDSVEGNVNITGTAADNIGLDKVEVDLYHKKEYYSKFHYEYHLETAIASGTDNWTYSLDTEGLKNRQTYIVRLRSYDANGFISDDKQIELLVSNSDTQAPVVTVAFPLNYSEVQGKFSVKGTSTDDKEINYVRYNVFEDNGPTYIFQNNAHITGMGNDIAWEFPLDTNRLPDGQCKIGVFVTDSSNKTTTEYISVNINNHNWQDDITAPEQTVAEPAGGETIRDTLVVSGLTTDNDAVERTEISIEHMEGGTSIVPGEPIITSIPHHGLTEYNWSYSVDTSFLDQGPYRITVVSYDASGNASLTDTLEVVISSDLLLMEDFDDGDISDWETSGTSLEPGGVDGTPFSMKLTDYSWARYTVDHLEPTYISFYVKVSSTDNYKAIYLGWMCQDEHFARLSFLDTGRMQLLAYGYVDCGPYVADQWYLVEFFDIDWQQKTLSLRINGEIMTTGVYFYHYKAIPMNKIMLYNTNGGSMLIDSILMQGDLSDDKIHPELSVTYPSEGATVPETFTVTGLATDGNGIQEVRIFLHRYDDQGNAQFIGNFCALLSGTTEVSWQYTFTLDNSASYKLSARAQDLAGNMSQSVRFNEIIIGD